MPKRRQKLRRTPVTQVTASDNTIRFLPHESTSAALHVILAATQIMTSVSPQHDIKYDIAAILVSVFVRLKLAPK